MLRYQLIARVFNFPSSLKVISLLPRYERVYYRYLKQTFLLLREGQGERPRSPSSRAATSGMDWELEIEKNSKKVRHNVHSWTERNEKFAQSGNYRTHKRIFNSTKLEASIEKNLCPSMKELAMHV